MSDQQKQNQVQKRDARRKRRKSNNMDHNEQLCTANTPRPEWLCRALLIPCNHNGELTYHPVCSPSHKLKTVNPCIHCKAKKLEYEPPTFCCQNGKVKLAPTKVSTLLWDLFTSTSDEAVEFRKNIRLYNSIFAFTSFGVKLDKDLASNRNGIYTFRAQGQIYHDLPDLIPEDGNPRFLQLYIYDRCNEIYNRMNAIKDSTMNKDIIQKLINILEDNPYAKLFRSVNDIQDQENLAIKLSADVKSDQRVYNLPKSDEVGAIWVEGNNNNVPLERHIMVQARSGHRHRVKYYYGCYDPLQYPLLCPNGENGWCMGIQKQPNTSSRKTTTTQQTFTSAENMIQREEQGMQKKTRGHVSCREYYSYKIQIREDEQSVLQLSERLFQQFLVDMYIKLETSRLDYFRTQQPEIRTEIYQGIVDSVRAGEARANKVGKPVVLPSSFIGGPRDMRKRYLDAMTLVQRYGKPDLFITMTCNPDWEEIQEELLPGQTPQTRPDITSRVFRAKLQDFKDQLYKKEIFGKVAAHVHVIEFQKRGLPHAHTLVILQHAHKLLSPDHFDRYVSAEIPDKHENQQLFDLVAKHMIHGPCGVLNPKCPCMKDDKCKFHYPRAYSAQTTQGKDGYPIYKRRNNGEEVTARRIQLDNRWVVPYNPYLLTRYNCHINVEVCSGFKAVKYLYKYIYKGHDRIAVQVTTDDTTIDEIKQFQDARWVSAHEAVWRMVEFDLTEMSPPVINLHVHLPNENMVSFWKGQNLHDVLNYEIYTKTMLTEFFTTCSIDTDARKFLYKEFPEYYVWDGQGKFWTKRKNKQVIGRVNAANPIEGERYYLRVLLNHVRGPLSYDDLLTVSGIQCPTFKESALKRGLLESDKSQIECMEEASTYKMPRELRRLFSIIIVHCEPTDIKSLWDTFSNAMSEDFNKQKGLSPNEVTISALKDIDYYLQGMGKDITKYNLPRLEDNQSQKADKNKREIQDEMEVQIPQQDIDAQDKLNTEQLKAYNTILDRLNKKKRGVFFIDGPGGTGKTFLYRALLANIRSKGLIALATASSGVAAAIMPGGRTAHSRFKIPLNPTDTSICNISKQSGHAEIIRRASIIIWDEAPMAKRMSIEAVDRTMRDLMENTHPFGGKIMIFGGDFRQVLPVVPRGTRQQTVDASLSKSYLWRHMEVLKLTTNMRARTDNFFGEFLLNVGNGDQPTDSNSKIQIPEEMVIKSEDDECDIDLINEIFPDFTKNSSSAEYMSTRAILATKNDYVDTLNNKMIQKFPGNSTVYTSYDEAIDDPNNHYQEEFLNTLMPNGMPAHRLELKLNSPIILLRNLDAANGLCNGTRMVCKGFQKNIICAEITVGQHSGKTVFLPRIPVINPENEGYPFRFKRKQFPIRLCFAMTINKAQGQTIPNVGVYLPEDVFSHGQLYVALSRGTSMSTTRVLVNIDKPNKRRKTITKNIVYKEVLLP